ncbi:flavin reductase family protein [Roseibium sp. CAU 1637]|uniref:Flavin reductase family protein n=1 Tax=Roseibium limicola TaxID=2816037 RepID=A0A939ELY2_9HYPH|nr:flavin reductase family protein [Roseibium limicola]MBO0344862.1 flavin reductase family protein [Roseibium limicola]
MFYETSANDHGLPHNPFKAIVSPRPIGWISSKDAEGRFNLAPYSFFNAIGDTPPMVMFSSTGYKDSVTNIDATGEFVCNFVSQDLAAEMNASSAPLPHGESEFERAGLDMAEGRVVGVPRVARAYAALECRHLSTQRMVSLEGVETNSWVVFGQVVGIHIAEEAIVDGRFDVTKVNPLARLGYLDYAAVAEVFQLTRPNS